MNLCKTRDERIEDVTNKHCEIMELLFKLQMGDDVDLYKIITLLRETYNNQINLIELLNRYEKLPI